MFSALFKHTHTHTQNQSFLKYLISENGSFPNMNHNNPKQNLQGSSIMAQ